MKNIFKFSALLAAAALMLAVSGCQQPLETAQYSDTAVTLASFGPNPVMRGGQLRFFGSNLDRIAKVEVPGVDAITEIEVVKKGKDSEIRVTLPVEGPEVGYVTLYSKENAKFTTKSQLTYTEPIILESFSTPEPAMPGNLVTLKGDYMNLVKAVIFTGGEEVEVEAGATRHEAKVAIPSNAKTGTIILSDKGTVENLIYSTTPLVMGKPTVKAAAKAMVKPFDEITFTGSYLDMIEKIVFEGGVEADGFILAEDGKSIKVDVPAEAGDGIFVAVSYDGDEFAAGEIEAIVPSALSVKPIPVKAGENLTIEGKDLDVVTRIDFPAVEGADFIYSEGKITAAVPDKATEGDIVLYISNGKAVTVPFELVKASVTSISPLSLYAGDDITVTGENLDLVTKATLGGKDVTIKAAEEGNIVLGTEASSVSGKIVLTQANGVTIEPQDEITLSYHSLVIVTSIPAGQHIGQEVVIKGEKLALVETIFIGSEKVTQYSLRTDSEIRFIMPWNKVGFYDVSFYLYDGSVEVQPSQIEVQPEQTFTTMWEGHSTVTWEGGGAVNLGWDNWKFGNVIKAGDVIKCEITVDNPSGVIRYGNGNWVTLPSLKNTRGDIEGNMPLSEGLTYYAVTLTQEDVNYINTPPAVGLVICGTGFTITKVTLIHDVAQEKTVWEGAEILSSWENHDAYAPDDLWVKAGLQVGMTVRVYADFTGSDWVIQMFKPHWGELYVAPDGGQQFKAENSPEAEKNGYVSFVMTDENIDDFLSVKGWGAPIILQGQNCTVTKMTIE